MSDTPPAPPPPPGTGAMTVPNPSPPKPPRPGSVEAAGWMLLGFAGVMAIGLAITAISLIHTISTTGFYPTPSMFLPLTIVAAIVLMLTVRMGYDAARLATFGLCGTFVGFTLSMIVRTIVLAIADVDPVASRFTTTALVSTLINAVMAAIAIAVMALLMTGRASDWFHAMRISRPPAESTPPARRPAAVLTIILLLVGLAIVTALYFVIGRAISTGPTPIGALIPAASFDAFLIIVLVVTAVLLGLGSEIGRCVTAAVCGYLALEAVYTFLELGYLALSSTESVFAYLIANLALAIIQCALAAIGYVLLSLRSTTDWFRGRRYPAGDAAT